MKNRITAGNSTYKKLAVQWLNEALCFVSSFAVNIATFAKRQTVGSHFSEQST